MLEALKRLNQYENIKELTFHQSWWDTPSTNMNKPSIPGGILHEPVRDRANLIFDQIHNNTWS